jgi:hypothetical protein
MARGWESKAVEDQQSAVQAEKQGRLRRPLTAAERDLQVRRDGLLLSRARVVRDLESARSEAHRALLERTLAHIDAALNEGRAS